MRNVIKTLLRTLCIDTVTMSKLRNPKSEASVSSEAAVYIATLCLARAGRAQAWPAAGGEGGLSVSRAADGWTS